jgi:large subunit ribosomal protein L31e
MAKTAKGTKKGFEPITRDYTVHLSKFTLGKPFKKRAPTAVRRLRDYVEKVMSTKDVRIDTSVNKFIWSQGIRNLPTRIRVRLSRRRNEDEEAKEKFYTLVQHIPVASFKALETEKVADE